VDRELERAVRKSVDAVAVSQDADDIMGRLEDPPEPTAAARRRAESVAPGSRLVSPTINYLEREARNHSLGKMGEKFALEFERARLRCVGAERLSYQVEYVAETRGDGLGYDILSFEADGSERLIEVKTTGFGKQTPFFVSRNELRVSQAKSTYHLYRVFAYRSTPRIFVLRGALDRVCALEPTLYVAGVG
jgi:hypothetical protein